MKLPNHPFYFLYLLLLFCPPILYAQDALNRSVQVSVLTQENPPRFDFSWHWDWSEGGYAIFKKSPNDTDWGVMLDSIAWGSTTWSDTDVQPGEAYEYAFFKKRFEKIVRQIEVSAGATYSFSIHNVYGDGLCCNFGHGWYLLQACGETLSGGSDFGFEKTDTFSVCDNGNSTETLSIIINPDMQTNNTWWTLKNANGMTVDSSGAPGALLAKRPKFGYIQAGIKLPAVEQRGSILLVVDDAYSTPLADELELTERDLIADGWKVIRREVSRNDLVTAVKLLIVNEYNAHPDLKMVWLIGHVPVPYSGNIYPDGHSENHRGAWPSDAYYGDMDGEWTDETVSNTSAQFQRNHNLPGDGKFDQSAIPSPLELAVTRVDLYDMPAFSLSDTTMLGNYLQRAHLFKSGGMDTQRRALVDDNLGIVLGAPAASGWRNFAPMFGADSLIAADYFSSMATANYLWSFGGGSGTHTSANGIGSTQDFAAQFVNHIFTMLCGSQFGDWDNSDNFLRAPLGTPGAALASCWVGNPPFFFHRMAMGEPIGYSLKRTQNATGNDYYPGPQLVHIALLGDPSLRLHAVKQPQNLSVEPGFNSLKIKWEAPDNEQVAGYFVYRADSLHGDFVRLHPDIVTGTFFTDENPSPDSALYMVRSVKLETSGSGTYWNLSLGKFIWSNSLCGQTPIETDLFSEICEGEAIEFNGILYTQSGGYSHVLPNELGCDSTVTLHLSVLPASLTVIDSILNSGQDTTLSFIFETFYGCDSIVQINIHVTEATENSRLEALKIFPNPASGKVNIQPPSYSGIADCYITDSTGRIIWSKKIRLDGNTFSLQLPPGVYWVKILTEKMELTGILMMNDE